jgi:hypothetical protein
MIEAGSLAELGREVHNCVAADAVILERLRADIRPLKSQVRRIHPRSATTISLVGTDGGNNQLRFDPFMLQLIRVVDSSQNEYCLEAVSQTTPMDVLDTRHLNSDGTGKTRLGQMLEFLGLSSLVHLSPTFQKDVDDRSPSWVQVYREMAEWAVLFSLVREKNYGTDTVILRDGDLRSKMWSGTLFAKFLDGINEGIRAQFQRTRRRIYTAGVLKHSGVLQTYRLAMALEGVLRVAYPCYLRIPRELERKVFKWAEFSRGSGDVEQAGGEANKFVGGTLYFCKFGSSPNDPIWPIDLLDAHVEEAATVFGYLLADSVNGFPIPYYPHCLQQAHEHAALVDFDFEILQDEIIKAVRSQLGERRWVVDELALQDADPSGRRYG